MRTSFAYAGMIVIMLAYIPLIQGIWNGRIRQSTASWGLWTTLDSIALGTTLGAEGSPYLTLVFTVGSGIVTLLLLFRGQRTWGALESWTLLGVVASVAIWLSLGPKSGLVASIIAIMCAGVPALAKAFHAPEEECPMVWILFGLGALLCLLGAPSLRVEDALFSASAVVMNCTMLACCFRKTWPSPTRRHD